MKKNIILNIVCVFCLITAFSWADTVPLSGKVVHISDSDVLNIRKTADYRSAKVGSLYLNTPVGIDYCRKVKGKQWCKIYELPAYGEDKKGWVNAKYLSTFNSGYVTIKGRENHCFVVLHCSKTKDQCKIVTEVDFSEHNDVSAIKTEWIDRRLLRATSNFGAASKEMEGYCTLAYRVADYLNTGEKEAKNASMEEK